MPAIEVASIPRHTRLGVNESDVLALSSVYSPPQVAMILKECPVRNSCILPFMVDPSPVTKEEFLEFYFSSDHALANERRLADTRYWETVNSNRNYRLTAPVVGATLAEASAFAFAKGGRLLLEEEYEWLVRSDWNPDLNAYRGDISDLWPASYDEVVEELLPVDHPSLPVTKLGVCGLWGNAREMVLGSPLASKRPYWKDHFVAVSKPLGARDKFWHPGLRIELYPYYHAHNPRLFNIEPPAFRVAYWPFSQDAHSVASER